MNNKSYTLQELADIFSVEWKGNPFHSVTGVNNLEEASASDASFLSNARYEKSMGNSQAGVICVRKDANLIEGKNYLFCDNPSDLFQKLVTLYFPSQEMTHFQGIHPTATIDPSVKIEEGITIGPFCVVEKGTKIGKGTVLVSHVYLGPNVETGEQCYLFPFSSVRERCHLGNRVILQTGAVIGSCGFGYLPDEKGRYQKLDQVGNVLLEDDVEIGANTTIDRARFKSTIIRKGSKIDNLIQIAHNVELGENNIIAAQTGIAGSAKTGNNILMGGQVGIVGHVEISGNTMIATRSGVSKSLKKPGRYRGSPAIDLHDYHRMEAHIRRIPKYLKRIEELEEKVKKLTDPA